MKLRFCTAFLALSSIVPASAALWTSGHGDIEMIYDGTEWEAAFLLTEDGEPPAIVDGMPIAPGTEFEIDEIDIQVLGPLQPSAGIPDSGADMVYLLSQDEALASALGNPYAGFAVDEIVPGILAGDRVTMSLLTVTGPGVFSLWETDAFGMDNILMSSAAGSGAPDQVDLFVDPGHYHFNVGFSEPGTYDVMFRSEGQLAGGGQTGNDFTVRYRVIPEPSSALLLSFGALLIFRRNRG